MKLPTGTLLQGGKYRIERVLGQGGFGITYLATQVMLDRQVAIKEFFMKDFCSRELNTMELTSTGSSKLVEQYRNKFIKEARSLARLHHPNIISVIDIFDENSTVYYVMPFLSGGSLSDLVRAHGPLSESEAMKYIKQIAKALKYMHEEEHICHYDIKPANILLNDKNNAVLIDFGISKKYDDFGHETSSTPIGISEGYAPIEQYQQKRGDFSPESDIYALGGTLYFLLHGKRPISSILRASGEPLVIDNRLSRSTIDMINSSMEISQRNRTKSTDVFFEIGTYVDHDSEDTIIEGFNKSSNSQVVKRNYSKPGGFWKKWGISIGLVLIFLIVAVSYSILLRKGPVYNATPENLDSISSDSMLIEDTQTKEYIKISSLGDFYYSYSGSFIDQKRSYPVELSFNCLDGIIQNCIYRNVLYNREIAMKVKEVDNGLECYAKDGNDSFILHLLSDNAPSELYGQTEIGSKIMRVSLNLITKSETKKDINKNEKIDLVKNAYENQLNDFDEVDQFGLGYYFLYDITKNGIPELWVITGTCEADMMLYVYTYTDRLVKIFETGADHSEFYQGSNYVLQKSSHMCYSRWNKIFLEKGKIHEKEVFKEYRPEGDYTEPKEKFAGHFPIDNLLPIQSIK